MGNCLIGIEVQGFFLIFILFTYLFGYILFIYLVVLGLRCSRWTP